MGELSEMLLDRMVYDPNRGIVEGALDVVKGVFRFSTSGVKMDISVNTPVASIGVRGTEFDVLATATTMEVAVHEGTVEVASAAGVVSVSRGQVYSVTPAGIGFADQASPEMQAAVTTMLSLVASRGDSGQASSQTAAGTQASPETAALPSTPQPTTGTDLENTLYMGLEAGRIVIELRPDLAPRHVERFKQLAREKFYDGLTFHFVRPGYVAETGDPTGTGSGGSGQTLAAEFSDQPFERGAAGMSRKSSDENSGDNQFYFALGRAANLDGKYTLIGQVVSGLDLLDALPAGRPPKPPGKILTLRVAADTAN